MSGTRVLTKELPLDAMRTMNTYLAPRLNVSCPQFVPQRHRRNGTRVLSLLLSGKTRQLPLRKVPARHAWQVTPIYRKQPIPRQDMWGQIVPVKIQDQPAAAPLA
jgi:hypothetical protein